MPPNSDDIELYRAGLEIDHLKEQRDTLLAACEAAHKLAVEIHDLCASGKVVEADARQLIQTNAAIIGVGTGNAIAATIREEEERNE